MNEEFDYASEIDLEELARICKTYGVDFNDEKYIEELEKYSV